VREVMADWGGRGGKWAIGGDRQSYPKGRGPDAHQLSDSNSYLTQDDFHDTHAHDIGWVALLLAVETPAYHRSLHRDEGGVGSWPG
jgi:hypothetical protein